MAYDLAAMRRLLERCDSNIQVFEEAIRKEQALKAEYTEILQVLEDQANPKIFLHLVPDDFTDDSVED